MGDLARRLTILLVVVVAAGCSPGSTDPTPAWPPTSEDLFELPTTTTRPPMVSDPVPIEGLDVAVAIPRDWRWETNDIRHGSGAAVFVADNRAGGLIVVGAVDQLEDASERGVAAVMAELLTPPADSGPPTETRRVGNRTTYAVPQEGGEPAVLDLVIDGNVYVALLYEADFPANRIAQGEAALASVSE